MRLHKEGEMGCKPIQNPMTRFALMDSDVTCRDCLQRMDSQAMTPHDAISTFTIVGPPRTKKNHGRVVRPKGHGRQIHLPSAAWEHWVKTAHFDPVFPKQIPHDTPVNVCAHIYRDAKRGDAVGYYQGLADLLEKRGVVADDVQIRSWDGSRMYVDSKAPRVEVVITEVYDPTWMTPKRLRRRS